MDVTQKDVRETAMLLNIDIDDDEMETITKSFVKLIDYFSVLDKVEIDEESQVHGDEVCRFREGEAELREHTEDLIERSEEHEDNYVLIPNIL